MPARCMCDQHTTQRQAACKQLQSHGLRTHTAQLSHLAEKQRSLQLLPIFCCYTGPHASRQPALHTCEQSERLQYDARLPWQLSDIEEFRFPGGLERCYIILLAVRERSPVTLGLACASRKNWERSAPSML